MTARHDFVGGSVSLLCAQLGCGMPADAPVHLPAEPSERVQPLRAAESLIVGARSDEYGPAIESFSRIAEGWSLILARKLASEAEVSAVDVALMVDWLKTCRLIQNNGHFDSWADKAGYTGLGWECAVAEVKKEGR